jgi:3-hydroxyacyl-CoA dehydrogenase
MPASIRRAAVIGAGTMGAQIAAHLANCGIPASLLDVLPAEPSAEERARGLTLDSPSVRSRVARAGLDRVRGLRPNPFYDPAATALVTCGNTTDHGAWLAEADWIVEAVVERLDVKREVHAWIETHRRPGTPVSSNTSGLRIRDIAEGRSEEYRRHFLGTHFFNPPRPMHLLEVIPAPDSDPDVVAALSDFGDRVLGKGVVRCHDTPNFIANRIGVFAMSQGLQVMEREGYSIEEVDILTGPPTGRPRSGTFRLGDIVGIDIMVDVGRNLYELIPEDTWRDRLLLPEFVLKLAERGWLGEKSGQGFYKRIRGAAGSEILTLDPATFEYRPRQRPHFPILDTLKNATLEERLRALAASDDRAGRFVWQTLSELLLYAGHRAPEIAGSIVDIDRAMRWGFNWELGPFEMWDAIGVERSVERMEAEGKAIPPLVKDLLADHLRSFYRRTDDGQLYVYDFMEGVPYVPRLGLTPEIRRHGHPALSQPLWEEAGIILLPELKARHRVVRESPDASLLDLGDGIACLEFHSKLNVLGPGSVQMMRAAVAEVEANFQGLVVGNHGPNFSAGANLVLILASAQEGDWDEIDRSVREFQGAIMGLKYCARPVVTAPMGLTLGGGCEVCLAGARVQAAAESYMGLVEVGVGVIPAGGGVKEMVIRCQEGIPPGVTTDLYPFLRAAFETIGLAKTSQSAHEARTLGFLRAQDAISINPRRHLHDAKTVALALAAAGYRPPRPRDDILVPGEAAIARVQLELHLMRQSGYISEHDQKIGTKLAEILCGSRLSHPARVSEQYLLDLEREAFKSLCGERKTQERMQHMLREGRPLRN